MLRTIKDNYFFFLAGFAVGLQHFNFENTKMYNIGKIPTVLITAITINQIVWPFLADFHKAKSFQTNDQIKITISNHIAIPACSASVVK